MKPATAVLYTALEVPIYSQAPAMATMHQDQTPEVPNEQAMPSTPQGTLPHFLPKIVFGGIEVSNLLNNHCFKFYITEQIREQKKVKAMLLKKYLRFYDKKLQRGDAK